MATVSPIDNQAPLLRSENEYSTSTDGNVAMPFGQWLDNQSNIENSPAQLEYNENYDRENATAMYNLSRPEGDQMTREANTPAEARMSMLPPQEPVRRPAGSNGTSDRQTAANRTENAVRETQNALKSRNTAPQQTGQRAVEAADTNATKASTRSQIKNAAKSRTLVTHTNPDQVAARQAGRESAAGTQRAGATKTAVPALSRLQDLEALKQLKTNIKAIFNGLKPLQSSSDENVSVRQSEQLKSNIRLVSVDNIKPIRLNTLPVEQTKLESNQKTTLQHLNARKTINLDASNSEATVVRDFRGYPKADTPAIDPKEKTGRTDTAKMDGAKTDRNTANAPTLRNNILFDTESAVNQRTSRARGRRNTVRQAGKDNNVYAQQQGPQHLAGNGNGNQQTPAETDAVRGNSWLQAGANSGLKRERVDSEGASSESKQNNSLFAKSNTAAQAAEAKQTTRSAPAYATRSLSWLKSLSDRTSFMNRTDPHWKVLEMRLDSGDGNMTIKVLREEEAVSVSVQFSDDNLRAHAESQASKILESLREQYGKDVSFSFAEREDSAYEALSNGGARHQNRLKKQVDEPGQTAKIRHFDPLSPDQHIWIG